MRFLESKYFPLLLGLLIIIVVISELRTKEVQEPQPVVRMYMEGDDWSPPLDDIPADEKGDLIRYGKELVNHTSTYLGPNGIIAHLTNGMNCNNCHLDAGTRNLANPFSAVAATYPKYRERSGHIESVEYRVNECMQRSLNGKELDSLSTEMKAFVAYIKWVGKDVPLHVRPKGAGLAKIPLLERRADPAKGQVVFDNYCSRCHGRNGEGVLDGDHTSYTYPPLWGSNSFNTGAGLLFLSRLAGFIKTNMPFDKATPLLTDEQAWDVAALISMKQRPTRVFPLDWPDISKKPFDFPFGPYTDSFSEDQHHYGPFQPIQEKKAGLRLP